MRTIEEIERLVAEYNALCKKLGFSWKECPLTFSEFVKLRLEDKQS